MPRGKIRIGNFSIRDARTEGMMPIALNTDGRNGLSRESSAQRRTSRHATSPFARRQTIAADLAISAVADVPVCDEHYVSSPLGKVCATCSPGSAVAQDGEHERGDADRRCVLRSREQFDSAVARGLCGNSSACDGQVCRFGHCEPKRRFDLRPAESERDIDARDLRASTIERCFVECRPCRCAAAEN